MKVSMISWTNETRSCIRRFSSDITVDSVAEKDFRVWGKQSKESGCTIISIDAAVIAYQTHRIDKFVIPCLVKGNVLSTMYVMLKTYEIPDEDILYVLHH